MASSNIFRFCSSYKPYRCKSSGCRKSKASKGDAVINYREPLATKELRYHGLSEGLKICLTKRFFLEFTLGLF